jgi:hypothetical protein
MPAEIIFEVDLDGAGAELERLQHPPTMALEGVLLTTFAMTEARVHVETGALKASGHPTSSFGGDVWEGTLSFDRYPGIYELARGPHRTVHQGGPGSHFFFDDVEARYPGDWTTGDAYRLYTKVIEEWLGMPLCH